MSSTPSPTAPSASITQPAPLTRSRIFVLAIPVIIANAAAPLLGLVDTAIISHTGEVAAVGAVALASLIFNFMLWGFGFLRMGTSGFVAQAFGANDEAAIKQHLVRAFSLGLIAGILLIALQSPLLQFARFAFDASTHVEEQLGEYWNYRMWSIPAALGSFAISGLLIGLGRYKYLLALQLLLNISNLIFDLVAVIGFEMGIKGIALGTAMAEWLCFLIGLLMLRKVVPSFFALNIQNILASLKDKKALTVFFNTNANIFWRTLLLLISFAIFTNMNAQLGDTHLAATHILLQFISLSAFFLDGFAHVAETYVGQALGAKSVSRYRQAVRLTSQCAFLTASALAVLLLCFGSEAISLLTPTPDVQIVASAFLSYAAIYVCVSFAAFQLDGIFIGALETRAMRNAAIMSTALFLGLSHWLTNSLGAEGIWLAFIAYVLSRASALMLFFKPIERKITP